ncbi:MAG: peptidylprolyl isomerase [Thermodesulfovibrionales bacterium]
MKLAGKGDSVRVHYTGRLADGTVFDSSRDREPLEFAIGERQVIRGFEEAVIGMAEGQSKTIEITAEESYGPRREDLVVTVSRSQMPRDLELNEGVHLQMRQPDGTVFNVLVSDLTEETVTLDANHPLAGKDLTFDIELVKIG